MENGIDNMQSVDMLFFWEDNQFTHRLELRNNHSILKSPIVYGLEYPLVLKYNLKKINFYF
jgi:hypothetical protein